LAGAATGRPITIAGGTLGNKRHAARESYRASFL
jgi:hypothetical protein